MFDFFDHCIWIAKDIENGKSAIKDMLGITPVDGGVHSGQGTKNALIGLGTNYYLEVLSPDPNQPQPGHWSEAIINANADGIFHWAARHDDLKSLHIKAMKLGYKSSGVLPFSRETADGQTFNWQLLFLSGHNFGALVPFFIDWGNTPHPSKNIPSTGHLKRFTLISPQAPALRQLLLSLHIDVEIENGSKPKIMVEIASKENSMLLPCLSPLGIGAQAPHP